MSQSIDREPWFCNGRILSPHKQMKLFYAGCPGCILDFVTVFNIMGWPYDEVHVPDELSSSAIRSLLGNMLSPPVIGGVLAAVFSVLG